MTPCQLDLNPSTVQATLDACMAILGRPDSPSNLALGTGTFAIAGLVVCFVFMGVVRLWGRRW